MNAKLSGPQRALLMDLREQPRYVSLTYPPAQKLLALGLTETEEARFGGSIMRITPSGLALLMNEEKP